MSTCLFEYENMRSTRRTYFSSPTTVWALASNVLLHLLSSLSGTAMALLTVLIAAAAREAGAGGDWSESQNIVGNIRGKLSGNMVSGG